MKTNSAVSAMRGLLASSPLARVGVNIQQWRRYAALSFKAEVSPWRVIWIDPRSIHGVPLSKSRIYPKSDRVVSQVLDGDWDLHRRDFWESEVARAIHDRIVDGADWGDTDLVARLTRELAVPGAPPQWHGSRTPTDVLVRCALIDRLIEDIRVIGYRAPSGIRLGESGLSREYLPGAVSIGIERDGQLVHLNGKHRLAIAMSLRLDRVPVRIGIRHWSWQSLREEHLTRGGPYMAHPDIAFMLDEFRAS